MSKDKRTILLPVAKEHADYIENFRVQLEKMLNTKITTRFTTEVLQQLLPINIEITNIELNNDKHLKKNRTVNITLRYKVGEI